MNILSIGSKVKCNGVKFNKQFVQCFSVEDLTALSGWRTHAYCKNMYAIASHKLGVFW